MNLKYMGKITVNTAVAFVIALSGASSVAGWDLIGDIERGAEAIGNAARETVETVTETVVETAPEVVVPGLSTAVKVAEGESLDTAVRDTAAAHTQLAATVTEESASLSTRVKATVGDAIVEPALGTEANKFYKDSLAIEEAPIHLGASAVSAANNAVESGDLSELSPQNIVGSAKIRMARDLYRDQAKPLPDFAMAAMPEDLKSYAKKARYIKVSDIGSLNIPKIATKDRNAIVQEDVIFVKSIRPYATEQENLYFWVHEVYHVKQYLDAGLQSFTSRYLGDEVGFKAANSDGINIIEREADEYTCAHYPVDTGIAYIDDCGLRGAHLAQK